MDDPETDVEALELAVDDAPVMVTDSRLIPYFRESPWVMGILNVTPDSFSDGGRWIATDAAVARGLELVAQGADLVDVGGESTRPGAHRVEETEEIDRVVPVIAALSAQGVQCSVDTTRAAVADAALEAGAVIINDVSGGLADPEMAGLAADHGCPWILMHWRGHSDEMANLARYGVDVTADVIGELAQQVQIALSAGVDERSLVLDPGLGFAKNSAHNWELLHQLHRLVDLGLPVLVGASRKRFLGELLAEDPGPDQHDEDQGDTLFGRTGRPRPPAEREYATAALSMVAARRGAWAVRVHEPRPTVDVLAVAEVLDGLDFRQRNVGRMDWVGPMAPPTAVAPISLLDEWEAAIGRPYYRIGSWNGSAALRERFGPGYGPYDHWGDPTHFRRPWEND